MTKRYYGYIYIYIYTFYLHFFLYFCYYYHILKLFLKKCQVDNILLFPYLSYINKKLNYLKYSIIMIK